jgi:hypothetical protein
MVCPRPRFQIGVFVAPGATTFTRMLRGGSVGAALLKVALKRKWVIQDLDSRA